MDVYEEFIDIFYSHYPRAKEFKAKNRCIFATIDRRIETVVV
jgi:hypothetical protein